MPTPQRRISGSLRKKTVYSVLPPKLREPLKKRGLENLTFADYETIEAQLDEYYATDQGKYMISACGACGGWP